MSAELTPTELQSAFAERLRQTRIARGFRSKAALARIMDVSDDTVETWERARNYPSQALLLKLIRILGVTSDYLLFGDAGGLKIDAYNLLISKPPKRQGRQPTR